jgi:ribulose-phosphate 3-epimerase
MKKMIIPAVIAKSQDELEKNILKVKDYVELIQLDFMDGNFVPNHSIDFDFELPESDCVYEAHLMVCDPIKWIKRYHDKVDMILTHFESCEDPSEVIKFVRSKNKTIGFVLNPETPVKAIEDYLDDLDQVLIMTVNPGFYSSPFLPEMLDKISELRKLKPNLDIEVDGGITDKTISLVNKAGANMFVSGSYIVKANNVLKAVKNLNDKIM